MAAAKKVFVETTVISLLVATRSRDRRIAERQMYTRAWWRLRNDFELYASTGVKEEAARGDPKEAAKRLVVLGTMRPLPVTGAAEMLAADLFERGILPVRAKTDGLHLATAMAHRMELLLTWNFKHLANPEILRQVYLWASQTKYNVPVVCTPEALLRSSYEQ